MITITYKAGNDNKENKDIFGNDVSLENILIALNKNHKNEYGGNLPIYLIDVKIIHN